MSGIDKNPNTNLIPYMGAFVKGSLEVKDGIAKAVMELKGEDKIRINTQAYGEHAETLINAFGKGKYVTIYGKFFPENKPQKIDFREAFIVYGIGPVPGNPFSDDIIEPEIETDDNEPF